MSDLAHVLVLGTGQVPASPADHTATPVDALVDGLGALERERAILLRAAGAALLRRAATEHPRDTSEDELAGEETLASPSARLAEVLETLLAAHGDEPLLTEALVAMQRAGLRVPERLLPRALARTGRELRAQLRPVLGARGAWLAGQRATWSWALTPSADPTLPQDVEARFADASAAERLAWLDALCRERPALARALFTREVKNEKPEQRLEWVSTLARHARPEDEPLFVPLLSDRSANVRAAAARALCGLESSEVAISARERLGALLRFDGALHAALPDEKFDDALTVLGVIETPPSNVGRRQFWLAQLVAAVSPARIASMLGLDAPTLVTHAAEHEHANALLDGLTAGALRFETPDFLAALWEKTEITESTRALVPRPAMGIAAALRGPDQTRAMLDVIEHQQVHVLPAFSRPWPAEVAALLFARMRHASPATCHVLELAARALPLHTLPSERLVVDVAEGETTSPVVERALDAFHTIADTRRVIAEETRT